MTLEINKDNLNTVLHYYERNIKFDIYNFLFNLGMNCKYVGFNYIADAVEIIVKKKQIVNFESDIYLTLAKRYEVLPDSIERNIRTAIKSSYSQSENMKKLFKNNMLSNKKFLINLSTRF